MNDLPGYYKGQLRPCECGKAISKGYIKKYDRFGSMYFELGCVCGRVIELRSVPGPLENILKLIQDRWNTRPAFDQAIDALIFVAGTVEVHPITKDYIWDQIYELTNLEHEDALKIYYKRQEKEK
jgi:hypothetical protein